MPQDNFDDIMEQHAPKLSETEQAALWQEIRSQVIATPVPSPYLHFLSTKHMAPLMIGLVVLLGAGGTVAASESAKPGDLLFPIERVVERTQLAFASKERAVELKAAFAAERFAELQEILEEEGEVMDDNTSNSDLRETATGSSTDTVLNFSAEADVFTDITVVIVEQNDVKRIFTTSTTTREGVIVEIVARYGVDEGTIDAALDFEIEDRSSRPSERGTVLIDDSSEVRVSKAVNVLLDQLEELDDDSSARDGLLTALMAQINKVEVRGRSESRDQSEDKKADKVEVRASETSRVKIDDDRVEVREDGYRIRIKDDGEVRVKIDDDFSDDTSGEDDGYERSDDSDSRDDDSRKSHDSEDDNNDRDDDDHRKSSDSRNHDDDDERVRYDDDGAVFEDSADDSYIRKAEVRVEKGRAEVRIEYNDRKLEYTTLFTARAALVAEVAVKTGLLAADIDAVLDIEID